MLFFSLFRLKFLYENVYCVLNKISYKPNGRLMINCRSEGGMDGNRCSAWEPITSAHTSRVTPRTEHAIPPSGLQLTWLCSRSEPWPSDDNYSHASIGYSYFWRAFSVENWLGVKHQFTYLLCKIPVDHKIHTTQQQPQSLSYANWGPVQISASF